MIGYEFKKIISQNISIIDIFDILIMEYDNEQDYDNINKEFKNKKKNELLNSCMKEKNSTIGKFIFAEFSLKNSDINLIKAKNVEKTSSYLFNRYLTDNNNNCCNKYIANISYKNPFLIDSNINLFMLSKNYNIEGYYSMNNTIVESCLSKNAIKALFSKNFDVLFNACNYFFIDFLIGFFFLFERKRKIQLKKKYDDMEKNNDNKIIVDNNIINHDDNINLEDSFIYDIIIIIFEIIIELQPEDQKIINYFLNDILNIRIKHFFEINVKLINNKSFI